MKIHICGKSDTYIPEAGCDDCEKLERRVATLETEVDELQEDVQSLDGRVTTLEECCDEVRTTLNSHDARITTNANNISGLGQQIQTVNNRLSNYYTKDETYTQAQVDNLISQIETGGYEEVSELPATGEPNIIYLVPKQGGGYERWIYSNGQWKDLGGTDIDLSGYVKVEDVIDMIHPVGDTVIRLDNTDPGTLYTGTTWQKISEGRMLIGANSTYTLGSTGGNATHTHTNPTTNGSSAANTGNVTLTAAQSGNQAQTITSGGMSANSSKSGYFDIRKWGSGSIVHANSGIIGNNPTGGIAGNNVSSSQGTSTASQRITTSFDVSHTHSVSVAAKNATQAHSHTMAHTHTQGDTGSASNMPPYLAVNIWIRTA